MCVVTHFLFCWLVVCTALVANLRDTHLEVFEGAVVENKEYRGGAVASNLLMGAEPTPLYNYCMNFKMSDQSIHQQIYAIIEKVSQKTLPEPERPKVCAALFFPLCVVSLPLISCVCVSV